MNPTVRRYLISSATTFLSVFFLTLGLELKSGLPSDISLPVVFGIVSVAGRAAVKAVIEWGISVFTPQNPTGDQL